MLGFVVTDLIHKLICVYYYFFNIINYILSQAFSLIFFENTVYLAARIIILRFKLDHGSSLLELLLRDSYMMLKLLGLIEKTDAICHLSAFHLLSLIFFYKYCMHGAARSCHNFIYTAWLIRTSFCLPTILSWYNAFHPTPFSIDDLIHQILAQTLLIQERLIWPL